jgi:hypothetical protein
VEIAAAAYDWGDGENTMPSLTLPQASAHVDAHSSTVVTLASAWPNSHYWSRSDPHLYTLEAAISESGATATRTTHDATAGAATAHNTHHTTTPHTAHTTRTRFGMRQFYRVADAYFLNGIKIRLRGDSLCLLNQGNRDLINEIGDSYGVLLDDNHATNAMGRAWIDAYKHANANIIRNHIRSIPNDSLFEHADEVGMLIEEETAFWNPGSVSNISLNPPYYLNYSDEAVGYYCEWVERWVREYRNHPSIILWSTTNEAWNPNDASELIAPLEQAALKNDPSRMVINDGFNKPITNEDSRHYYGGYPSGMTSAPDIYDLYQIDSDLPLGAGEEFSVSTAGIPQYAEDGTIKDIYHGRLNGNPDTISRADFGREVGRVTRGVRTTRMANWKPFCLSMFIYDNIEKYVPLDQAHTSCGLNPKMLIRPQFDPTAAGSARWVEGDGYRYFANSYADVAAYDKEFDREPRLGLPHRIYQLGTSSKRTIIIHNDEEIDGTELQLNWKVAYYNTQSGESHDFGSGSDTVEVGHGEFIEHPITITVPGQVESYESKLMLTLEVVKAGRIKFSEDNMLGWIGRPAPAKIGSSHTDIDLGRVDWQSRLAKHCIHLRQDGGALSEQWTARVIDDAEGAISLERLSGNLRHEQEQFYTLNVAGLTPGHAYSGLIEYTGEQGDNVAIAVHFIAGAQPTDEDALDLAAGATVRVSSCSEANGWTCAALVDGQFTADYNRFGWSSDPSDTNQPQWAVLKLSAPERIAQVVLAPRGENPGGTIAEAFHGEGEGVGGVLEFAAGHKAHDPNTGQGFPLDFAISVSADGDAWTRVASRTNYPLPDNGKARAFDFDPIDDVRYIKVEASALRANPNEGGKYAMQLVEIAAYADAHMPAIPSQPTDVSVRATAHDVHISWKFSSDGRSPLLGTSLTLVRADTTVNTAGADATDNTTNTTNAVNAGNTANAQPEIIPVTVQGTETGVLVHNVPAGEWSVAVRGRNAIGEGDPSAPVPFAVGQTADGEVSPALATPAKPTAELMVESGAVTVSWQAIDFAGIPAGKGGYTVHLRSCDTALASRTAWVPSSDGTTVTLPNVATGTYTATVEATDDQDRSTAASPASDPVIVATAPAKPNKPGVTSTDTVITVTWQAPADGGTPVQSYVLTLRNLTENTVKVVKAGAGETSKKVDGLTAGNYTASIIAVNAIGMSAESSPSLPCIIK